MSASRSGSRSGTQHGTRPRATSHTLLKRLRSIAQEQERQSQRASRSWFNSSAQQQHAGHDDFAAATRRSSAVFLEAQAELLPAT
eukprot:4490762-Prymnesium_polylepis.1